MKKTVLTFGLISGAIMMIMMLITMPFSSRIGYDKALVVGYTTMVLAFMLLFMGIRSYRENVGGGSITFGRGFAVGILITLIACLLYAATWDAIYFGVPGFSEKFIAFCNEHARHSGVSAEAAQQQIDSMKRLLGNPLLNGLMAFIEPLPVGLLVTLISAAILRKKPEPPAQETAAAAA